MKSSQSRILSPRKSLQNLRKSKSRKMSLKTSRKRSASDLALPQGAVLALAINLVRRNQEPRMLVAGAVAGPRVQSQGEHRSRKIRERRAGVIARLQDAETQMIKTGTLTDGEIDLFLGANERLTTPGTDGIAAVSVRHVAHGVAQHDATSREADLPGETTGSEPGALRQCALEIGTGKEKETGTMIVTGTVTVTGTGTVIVIVIVIDMVHTLGALDPVVGAHTDQIAKIDHAPRDEGVPGRILVPGDDPSRALERGLFPSPRRGIAPALVGVSRAVQNVSPSEPAHDHPRASPGRLLISIRTRKRCGSKSKSGSERRRPRRIWLHKKRPARRASRSQALTLMWTRTRTRAIALPT